MESEFLEALAQYGPLGLWTAWLLWVNYQQRKDEKEREKEAKEALKYHQEHIANALIEHRHMLEKSIEKKDQGLAAMREKYAEDRILRTKNK